MRDRDHFSLEEQIVKEREYLSLLSLGGGQAESEGDRTSLSAGGQAEGERERTSLSGANWRLGRLDISLFSFCGRQAEGEGENIPVWGTGKLRVREREQ